MSAVFKKRNDAKAASAPSATRLGTATGPAAATAAAPVSGALGRGGAVIAAAPPLPDAIKSIECWVVMEFADIGSLEDELSSVSALWEEGLPNGPVLFTIAASLAKGLRFIHGRGIFHGNLHPSNIVFCERGGELQVKLVDILCSPSPKPSTPARYVPPEGEMSIYADVVSRYPSINMKKCVL